MKTKFLYFNGAYVYTNEELLNEVQKRIDKSDNKDSLIRLLSDLYRNGHLCEFCQQEEYENGVEKKDYIITFDNNLIGDIRIANHVIGRLKHDDSYAPFVKDFHKHFEFSSVSVLRKDEPKILSTKSKQAEDGDTIFLLNGFRKHIHLQNKAYIQIKYVIDNKESLNEQIPVFINGKKTNVEIDLSKAKEKQEIKIPILETLLDPVNDMEVWFGSEGDYGRIILKAPQINVPIQFNGETIIYPMMRIFRGTDYIYMGIWPFEYNNSEEWKDNICPYNFLYEEYYAKRNIEFYLRSNTPTDIASMRQEDFLGEFKIADYSLFNFTNSKHCCIDIPLKREWEYVACLHKQHQIGDFVLQNKDNESYNLCHQELEIRFAPNAYGVYAMLGNIFEIAKEGEDLCYMGGDLLCKEDEAYYSASADRVPFFSIRFVVHDKVFAENEFNFKPDKLKQPDEPLPWNDSSEEDDRIGRIRMDYF